MNQMSHDIVDLASDEDETQTVKTLTEIVSNYFERISDVSSSNNNTKPLLEFALEFQNSLKDQSATLE